MNENQQNFESLRRLLALKRHETPPPGYFNNFSRQVMARIRVGEAEASASLSERFGMSWLLKWLQGVETTSMFAGSFATVLCLLLLFGAVMAQRPEAAYQAFLQPSARDAAPLPMVAVAAPMPSADLGQPTGQITIADNSTNPVIDFASAPVGQMPVSAQFTTFPLSGN